jgi:hypothetical protein
MKNLNERPVCHRAEDLVTYLYGEAGAADAQDFGAHLQQCDACRAEFGVFNSVHESIVIWRNEALGTASIRQDAVIPEANFNSGRVVHARKLSALAALREFFTVSPLWLRGATAFAALVLCVLGVVAISRVMQKPREVARGGANEKIYTRQDFETAVNTQVKQKVSELNNNQSAPANQQVKEKSKKNGSQQLASNRSQLRAPGVKGLSRKERLQLAADLQLIPRREEGEFPFVFSDEPER